MLLTLFHIYFLFLRRYEVSCPMWRVSLVFNRWIFCQVLSVSSPLPVFTSTVSSFTSVLPLVLCWFMFPSTCGHLICDYLMSSTCVLLSAPRGRVHSSPPSFYLTLYSLSVLSFLFYYTTFILCNLHFSPKPSFILKTTPLILYFSCGFKQVSSQETSTNLNCSLCFGAV